MNSVENLDAAPGGGRVCEARPEFNRPPYFVWSATRGLVCSFRFAPLALACSLR
jgi:hypothetical protein